MAGVAKGQKEEEGVKGTSRCPRAPGQRCFPGVGFPAPEKGWQAECLGGEGQLGEETKCSTYVAPLP